MTKETPQSLSFGTKLWAILLFSKIPVRIFTVSGISMSGSMLCTTCWNLPARLINAHPSPCKYHHGNGKDHNLPLRMVCTFHLTLFCTDVFEKHYGQVKLW